MSAKAKHESLSHQEEGEAGAARTKVRARFVNSFAFEQ
jgi:hypothetical protein